MAQSRFVFVLAKSVFLAKERILAFVHCRRFMVLSLVTLVGGALRLAAVGTFASSPSFRALVCNAAPAGRRYDPGGYFIIRGTERVLMMQAPAVEGGVAQFSLVQD